MSVTEHKQEAPNVVRCKIITVSDTRTKETDKSGKLIKDLLEEKSFVTAAYEIVTDEETQIRRAVEQGLNHPEVDAVLLSGGTGIAKRDITIETVTKMFDKEITGFGELFRMLSYTEDIGSAAIMSRASAGVKNGTAVFAMPGSSGAVKLAMNKLILPELAHVVREIKKDL
ncbi:MogA/MoaB family molybdenum cofactor biosynthesis protein [Alkalicoccus halolimnae]|uniref:Molybdenum cofactor biosynthesis protein B n=1 Tax=Alkalicoccus halolimnae TaxID=1667239 RepID=A0A5C7FEL6_9BACI|nr:MogA/MoaB family molybdenum cofactor biosynthesis protein [Alkalicoccus halolimnae]TXF84011.1 MogA/MoaB family molybdenum cofactor biosynthesis protein [Alkalicoccus halolimnae]